MANAHVATPTKDTTPLRGVRRGSENAAHCVGLAFQIAPSSKRRASLVSRGTTSVGLAAAVIAKATVPSSRRPRANPDREKLLRASGADQVCIDTGSIAKQVREVCGAGVDKVPELVGATKLEDSLRCAKQRGILFMPAWSATNGLSIISVLYRLRFLGHRIEPYAAMAAV